MDTRAGVSASSFQTELTVRMQHTDAAGVLFFPRLFELAHLVYERWLDAIELPVAEILAAAPYVLPIASATGEYRQPLRVGARLQVTLTAQRAGEHSYEVQYRFVTAGEQREAASVVTRHVAIDKATRRPVTLPEVLAGVLDQP